VKLAIPDLISPSYFPAIAAVELGFLDAELELIYPVTRTYEDLREGRLDFVGGASHAPLYAFKDWEGCRLLCALAQHMYWFLVVKSSLDAKRGDLNAVKGLRIGAAPGPVDGLKQLLKRAGIDPAKDVQIGPVPGLKPGEPASFGLLAARALQEGKLDGFWANGMGCEIALKGGFGALLLDARRDGPDEIRGYTFPALVTSDRLIREKPEAAPPPSGASSSPRPRRRSSPSSSGAMPPITTRPSPRSRSTP
jgi:NitT/TauT family transport system substrate-binding protein